ncbi:MAG TPA: lanthionine synthetase C family protein [Thermoanaerobaculia bacterium]|nr:lanthionine synthetase C family protein [Thermoanaerobaculia bacterium]
MLTGPAANLARNAIRALASDLARFAETADLKPSSHSWFGLDGCSGIALFFSYYERSGFALPVADTVPAVLDLAIENLRTVHALPALHGGFTGLAWTIEHFLKGDPDSDDPGQEIALRMVEHLDQSPWTHDYDLIAGLAGFAVWARERMPSRLGADCLARVVARFAETAERRPEGIAWRTRPEHLSPHERERFPEGNFNLGVAHGVPGAIGALAVAYAAGVERETAFGLIEGAVSWLLAQRLANEAVCRFPFNVWPGAEPKPTGLGWCYGDLGISAALLVAARAIGRADWEREALDLGRKSALRPLPLPDPSTGKTSGDACVCHGAAGNGHLFHCLFHATGDTVFAEAAHAWFDRALDLREPGTGIGGFLFWEPDDDGNIVRKASPGLLNGAAGVGLALLAAVGDVEPEWDRLLLASLSARDGSP